MQVDVMSRTPIYEQIVDQLSRFILTGVLKPLDQLPSVRGLSVELSINPNTILKAYTQLDKQGLIFSIPGKGYFVTEDAAEKLRENERSKLSALKTPVTEAALAGIPKEEVLSMIEQAYAAAAKIKEGDHNT